MTQILEYAPTVLHCSTPTYIHTYRMWQWGECIADLFVYVAQRNTKNVLSTILNHIHASVYIQFYPEHTIPVSSHLRGLLPKVSWPSEA